MPAGEEFEAVVERYYSQKMDFGAEEIVKLAGRLRGEAPD